MLDIQLRIFKAVAEKKSFSRAAQELHMTQSSVSQQIQNLETYYGVKFFDRLHRKIELTQAGAALYPYAVEIERLYDRAQKAMQGIMQVISGKLHIGASLTIGEYLMPGILVSFSTLYPQVDIAMDIYNTEQITAMVVNGDINLGFVEGPYEAPEAIIAKNCGGDELVIIAPVSCKRLKGGFHKLSELLSERWVMREKNSGTRQVFEQYVVANGFDINSINVIMELGSTQAIKEAVKAGLGIAAISQLSVADEIRHGELSVISLAEGSLERKFTMLRHRERFQTSAIECFIQFVQKETEK